MKKILLLPFTLFTFLFAAHACTTFLINKDGYLVFGRNYDWITGTGVVNQNLRNMTKVSMELEPGKSFSWTSRFGSLTFNQYGKEFPTGGMNEKGLVVELMWLQESRFPEADQRPALSVLQWIQYQLDNSGTVADVIATDKDVRISAQNAPQHYLVADAAGSVATIEFLDGKMVVHTGSQLPYPVLTNSTYAESAKAVSAVQAKKGSSHFRDNSLDRFNTACSMINTYKLNGNAKAPAAYAFDVLKAVSQGEFTKWSIVYDLTNKKVAFRTFGFDEEKSFSFADFDFSCTAQPLSMDMNQAVKGNVRPLFLPYTAAMNGKKLREAFYNSRSHITVSEAEQEGMAAVAEKVSCKK